MHISLETTVDLAGNVLYKIVQDPFFYILAHIYMLCAPEEQEIPYFSKEAESHGSTMN